MTVRCVDARGGVGSRSSAGNRRFFGEMSIAASADGRRLLGDGGESIANAFSAAVGVCVGRGSGEGGGSSGISYSAASSSAGCQISPASNELSPAVVSMTTGLISGLGRTRFRGDGLSDSDDAAAVFFAALRFAILGVGATAGSASSASSSESSSLAAAAAALPLPLAFVRRSPFAKTPPLVCAARRR